MARSLITDAMPGMLNTMIESSNPGMYSGIQYIDKTCIMRIFPSNMSRRPERKTPRHGSRDCGFSQCSARSSLISHSLIQRITPSDELHHCSQSFLRTVRIIVADAIVVPVNRSAAIALNFTWTSLRVFVSFYCYSRILMYLLWYRAMTSCQCSNDYRPNCSSECVNVSTHQAESDIRGIPNSRRPRLREHPKSY